MRATVIIDKRANHYVATVSGKFGGGFMGAHVGTTPEQAAGFAARQMVRYACSNSEGGDLVAPAEVLQLVPDNLRSVPART
jgi:hypothetical protein